MAKITSKYQVTLPKAIADQYRLRPGDEIDWVAAGDVIKVVPPGKPTVVDDAAARLNLFDQASERVRRRSKRTAGKRTSDRGWKRGDLYTRGRSH